MNLKITTLKDLGNYKIVKVDLLILECEQIREFLKWNKKQTTRIETKGNETLKIIQRFVNTKFYSYYNSIIINKYNNYFIFVSGE